MKNVFGFQEDSSYIFRVLTVLYPLFYFSDFTVEVSYAQFILI